MDRCVVGELWGWGVGRDGDGEVVDVDVEEMRTEDGALRDSVGHWEEGASATFVSAGHFAAGEVVGKPEADGAGDVGLVEKFPNEALGPDGVEGFSDVKRDEKVVPFPGPRLVRCLYDGERLFFS